MSGITGDDEDCGTLMPAELDFSLEGFEGLVEVDVDDEDDEIDGGRDWDAMCGQCESNDDETELRQAFEAYVTRGSALVTPVRDTADVDSD